MKTMFNGFFGQDVPRPFQIDQGGNGRRDRQRGGGRGNTRRLQKQAQMAQGINGAKFTAGESESV